MLRNSQIIKTLKRENISLSVLPSKTGEEYFIKLIYNLDGRTINQTKALKTVDFFNTEIVENTIFKLEEEITEKEYKYNLVKSYKKYLCPNNYIWPSEKAFLQYKREAYGPYPSAYEMNRLKEKYNPIKYEEFIKQIENDK